LLPAEKYSGIEEAISSSYTTEKDIPSMGNKKMKVNGSEFFFFYFMKVGERIKIELFLFPSRNNRTVQFSSCSKGSGVGTL
jgi:hypothetical protein